jgi:uncharacterized protein
LRFKKIRLMDPFEGPCCKGRKPSHFVSSFERMKNVDRAQKWVVDFVIEHTLCPFARVPYEAGQVRFCEIGETDVEAILDAFWTEVDLIDRVEKSEISNSILVIPALKNSFGQYLDVFNMACDLLELQNKAGKFQLASFHPLYQFVGTDESDPTNYTNRSPLPLIHIIRTEEVAQAIESHPDIDSVPIANQAKMRAMGEERLRSFLESLD